MKLSNKEAHKSIPCHLTGDEDWKKISFYTNDVKKTLKAVYGADCLIDELSIVSEEKKEKV